MRAVERERSRPSGYGQGVGAFSLLQRSRILSATVAAVSEDGYAEMSVARITSRARVSRRTFYELFGNREECLLAVLDSALDSINMMFGHARLGSLPWRERVRVGLFGLLAFFDREPQLARVCVLETVRGGPLVLERRALLLDGLAKIVDEGRLESAQAERCTPLTAEGVVGAVLTVIAGSFYRKDQVPLTGIYGELLSLVFLPYIGVGATRREQSRPNPVIPELSDGQVGKPVATEDPLRGSPMRLTSRTARVLEVVAEHPGQSNRVVGKYAGIEDQGQSSKLLARLKRLNLIENDGGTPLRGEPNAWVLTEQGHEIATSIRAHRTSTIQGERV